MSQSFVAEPLFSSALKVANIGIADFGEALRKQSVEIAQLDWQPPADGNQLLIDLLKQIYCSADLVEKIDTANQTVIQRIKESKPQIVDISTAGEAMGLPPHTITHAGPPISWERMAGPQKRGVMGAAVFEGWARDFETAEQMIAAGDITLGANHQYHAVGPMTGIISPSMPVFVAKNDAFGNYAFSAFNEGRGNTMWFGVVDDGTLARLGWFRDELGPALKAAIHTYGPFDVFDVIAQGLQMGDECHSRHAACTSLLVRRLVPAMLDAGAAPKTVAAFVRFADANGHFFLNITMAAVKATMDAAHGVPFSTVVTAMSRNGVDFMMRVSGLGDRWLICPVSAMDEAVYYTGYTVADAAGDIGDSAIIETCGLGGMAIASAPTVASWVGGSLADEIATVRAFSTITLDKHDQFRMPPMDMANTPLGIDIRLAVETRTVPFITTGVLHEASPTTGQIGTGIARVPVALFDMALMALAQEWGLTDQHTVSVAEITLEPEEIAYDSR